MKGNIIGSYQILGELARGGMAAVYLARHVRLGNLVAIKILFAQFEESPEVVERFLEEARIQANLKHPNILAVHDVLETPTCHGMVMEFLEGSSLSANVRRLGVPMDVPTTIGIFKPVVDALAYAHEADVVHRDLKPSNVFLSINKNQVVPKIVDFGIAKVRNAMLITQKTAAGSMLGTPQYMAPEQFEDSSQVDHRADIWAVGAMLYELVCGRLPFTGSTVTEIMRGVLTGTPALPSLVSTSVDKDFEAIVMRCLQRERDQRYGSAFELYKDLESCSNRVGSRFVAVNEIESLDLKARGIEVGLAASSSAVSSISVQLSASSRETALGPDQNNGVVKIGLNTNLSVNDPSWRPTSTPHIPSKGWSRWWLVAAVLAAVAIGSVLLLMTGPGGESGSDKPASQSGDNMESSRPGSAITPGSGGAGNTGKPTGQQSESRTNDTHATVQVQPVPQTEKQPSVRKELLTPLASRHGLQLGRQCAGESTPNRRAVNALLMTSWRGLSQMTLTPQEFEALGTSDKEMETFRKHPKFKELNDFIKAATKPLTSRPLAASDLDSLAEMLSGTSWSSFAEAKSAMLCDGLAPIGAPNRKPGDFGMSETDFDKRDAERSTVPMADFLWAEINARALCCSLEHID